MSHSGGETRFRRAQPIELSFFFKTLTANPRVVCFRLAGFPA